MTDPIADRLAVPNERVFVSLDKYGNTSAAAVAIALDEAKRMNLTLPSLTLVHGLYQRVQALGHGRSGTHALMLALEELSDTVIATTVPPRTP